MRRLTILVTAGAAVLAARPAGAQVLPPPPAALRGARQLVLVNARGWDDTTAVLRRYARATVRSPWRAVGDAIPVVLGRSGLAWGAGQGSIPAQGAVPKREGDGRSPAGAYPLLYTFSNVDVWFTDTELPRVQLGPQAVCVDDVRSALYNTVADGPAARSAPWASAERMAEVRGYRAGVVVGYNGARTSAGLLAHAPAVGGRPAPGRGSCIFLHVWDGPGRPTAGCTAMDEAAMAAVIAWADPALRPVLVQLPRAALARLRGAWGLPAAP